MIREIGSPYGTMMWSPENNRGISGTEVSANAGVVSPPTPVLRNN